MAEPTTKTGKRSKLRWVLGISLALNLLIIGAVAGAAYRFSGGHERRVGNDMHSYGAPYVRALPREARQGIRSALKAERRNLPSRKERRQSYAQLLAALRAETFDQGAVEALFDAQGTAALKVQSTAQAAWLKEVSGMSVAQRSAVADRLEELLKRGPRKRPKKQRE